MTQDDVHDVRLRENDMTLSPSFSRGKAKQDDEGRARKKSGRDDWQERDSEAGSTSHPHTLSLTQEAQIRTPSDTGK